MLKKQSDRAAFPLTPGSNSNFGLTVREYFIAAAMQGILANTNSFTPEQLAQKAIGVADEVLRQV
ncbi:hypothetical protein IV454_16175 [Massilia antarctica]|uniref:Uncharacterized protein n=1 Tax=Massilia antarctica TaxID=2765360 RepID=A0AA48WKE3_9BURK|nr:hypothetical protein [Massilia antarctica]QPI52884.1 hypothetical protein IV454_16175 [Massilia antarctica]